MVLPAFLAILVAASASAQSICAKLEYRVAAGAAKAKASCHAKAAALGVPVDAACLAAADAKLARDWSKASLKGDCPTTATASAAQQVVDAFVANLEDLLTPTVSYCCATGSSCYAGPAIDPGACLELLGTMGPPGSVCEGATGHCVPPPGAGGSCCALPQYSICTAAPDIIPASCVSAGGSAVPNAVCQPDGACVVP